MISETEARNRILASIRLPTETCVLQIDSAFEPNYFSASRIVAQTALPPFDQSAMDGYAIRHVDRFDELTVTGEQPAGIDRGLKLEARCAVRIFTGAPVPRDADTVVMQEDTVAHDGRVKIAAPIDKGEHIRPAGSDVCIGQLLLDIGDLLTPQRVALLVSAGVTSCPVYQHPRVAIISTGDEIRDRRKTDHLDPGCIWDSNAPMLAAAVRSSRFAVETIDHAGDSQQDLLRSIESCASCDAIVLCGGVSVGDHDVVRPVLESVGATTNFWQVAVKPGKPFIHAVRDGRQHYFGLPGNPASAFVTFHLFVRPALARMAGATLPQCMPFLVQVLANDPLSNPTNRTAYIRGSIADGSFSPHPNQSSGALSSLGYCNFLARLNPTSITQPGEKVSGFVI